MDITKKDVIDFLSEGEYRNVQDIKLLAGGKHSEAFSFKADEKVMVIRFNETDFGFKKDKYANENYFDIVPIPKIIEIGTYKSLYFSISVFVEGHSIRDEYNKNDFTSLTSQFDAIEKIASIPLPTESKGYGEWDPLSLVAPYSTLEESVTSIFSDSGMFNWRDLKNTRGFEESFVEHLKKKIHELLPYSKDVRELRHGDFGNENVLIKDGEISGIIDWHKASYDDRLFDIGRVVLYCPDRFSTSKAALDYYKDKKHQNYKERIFLGVYLTMLANYGFASKAGNTPSLKSSPIRISEIEKCFLA